MIDLRHLQAFCYVAEMGSFAKAADLLKISKSKISRDIADFEDYIGTPLLYRSTRSVSLTSTGKKFFESTRDCLKEVEDRVNSALHDSKNISGTLRITAPEDIGSHILVDVVTSFSRAYPDVRIDLLLTEQPLDYVKESIDLGVRIGKPKTKNLMIKRLSSVDFLLVGRRAFVESHALVSAHPSQLKEREFMVYGPRKSDNLLRLTNGDQNITLPVNVLIASGSFIFLSKIATRRNGITVLPKFVADPYVKNGELFEVCKNWRPAPRPLYLVSQKKLQDLPPHANQFSRHLINKLSVWL